MAAAFIEAGIEPHQACILAARANRTAGALAKVTPASPVSELIDMLPGIFKANLCSWSGICTI